MAMEDLELARMGGDLGSAYDLDYSMDGPNAYQSELGYTASDFGSPTGLAESSMLGDFGGALSKGWDFVSGGLDTLSGLAGLYMDWDKLQSTKSSVRDQHNAAARQYNNYLQRSKDVSGSMGLSAGSRRDVKQSTV